MYNSTETGTYNIDFKLKRSSGEFLLCDKNDWCENGGDDSK